MILYIVENLTRSTNVDIYKIPGGMIMKRSRYLAIVAIVAFLLSIPLTWVMDGKVAKAATTPSFEKT